jgi:WXG100 family type VII secretion target
MTFDGIKVQHGKLEMGAADVMQAAKDIEARLDNLENDLNPLRNDWNGSAKQAYADAKAKWDQAMTDMIQLLEQASRGVEASNAEYRAADNRGANRF